MSPTLLTSSFSVYEHERGFKFPNHTCLSWIMCNTTGFHSNAWWESCELVFSGWKEFSVRCQMSYAESFYGSFITSRRQKTWPTHCVMPLNPPVFKTHRKFTTSPNKDIIHGTTAHIHKIPIKSHAPNSLSYSPRNAFTMGDGLSQGRRAPVLWLLKVST